jgi:hypothetical protein
MSAGVRVCWFACMRVFAFGHETRERAAEARYSSRTGPCTHARMMQKEIGSYIYYSFFDLCSIVFDTC